MEQLEREREEEAAREAQLAREAEEERLREEAKRQKAEEAQKEEETWLSRVRSKGKAKANVTMSADASVEKAPGISGPTTTRKAVHFLFRMT